MPDLSCIVREIDADLPELARGVIRRHLDLSAPENEEFLSLPDGREQHQTEWHQWGIITHTRAFLRAYQDDIPRYLHQWGLWKVVSEHLSEPVDGVPRGDLLKISILLHDIGKFGARRRGRTRFHFAGHEVLSGEVIRGELELERLGLTAAQVEYVARTAEDHFVLGVVRKRAREHGRYDLDFTTTGAFSEACWEVREAHPDDFLEIGVLFLGDSLAKTNPRNGPARAISQYAVNIAVAHRYLDIVTSGERPC